MSFLVTYQPIFNKINTTGSASGKRSAYPSGAPEFTSCFSVRFRVLQSLVSCLSSVLWISVFFFNIFVLFHLFIVSSVLQYTASDNAFGSFKPFFILFRYLFIYVCVTFCRIFSRSCITFCTRFFDIIWPRQEPKVIEIVPVSPLCGTTIMYTPFGRLCMWGHGPCM